MLQDYKFKEGSRIRLKVRCCTTYQVWTTGQNDQVKSGGSNPGVTNITTKHDITCVDALVKSFFDGRVFYASYHQTH